MEVKSDTPPVAAENLEHTFTDVDNTLIRDNSATITIKLVVDQIPQVPAGEAALVDSKLGDKELGLTLDAKLLKTITGTVGDNVTDDPITDTNGKMIKVVLQIPAALQSKAPYSVIRVHGTGAEILSADYDAALHTITFQTDKFSTYAIAYTAASTPPSPGNTSSSGGGNSVYPPVINSGEHGATSVSPKSPGYGDQVIIAPKPNDGYAVNGILVTDKDGKDIALKDKGDGTYAFTQPGSKVTITVTFRPERPRWNPFEDVLESQWFYDCVKYVYENGLMSGTSHTTFRPDWDTSRGMIITILWHVEGNPTTSKAAGFTDVTPDQYYADAVDWGVKNGIIAGYGDGRYGPEDSITREQLATILHHYAQYRKWDVSIGENTNILSYQDFRQISPYAVPAIQWAAGSGILSGKGSGILDPQGKATRAETASMLHLNLTRR